MKASDDLFQLIKSMSKSEKGYFKKFAAKHSAGKKNIYIRLFDAIEKLDKYEETIIKEKFKGEKFSETLYSVKNYLFRLILKALSSYHSEKFAVSRLNMMMTELNVLFEKGLYKQFRTLLSKAISAAKENDKPFYLALLYNKALTSVATDYYSEDDVLDYEMLKKETLDNLKVLNINEQYHILYNDMFMFTKKTGSIRDEKDLGRLNEIIKNPLLQNESNAVSFDAKFKYYTILGHYYRITGDNESWIKYRHRLVKLMESGKKYIKENPRSYIMALNNYLNACILTKNFGDFDKTLDRLKKFSKQFEGKKEFLEMQSRVFLLVSDLELNYCIKTNRFENLIKLINDAESGFVKFGIKIAESRKISLYNRIAYAAFLTGDYDKSIYYLNRIINLNNPAIEPEQHIFARIRSLIVHYEAGNFDLLEYSIKSTKRFLEKNKRIFRFEKLIMKFISEAVNYPEESDRKELYKKLKNDITGLMNDRFEKNVLEQFDFLSWTESKIKKITMPEMLKLKAA